MSDELRIFSRWGPAVNGRVAAAFPNVEVQPIADPHDVRGTADILFGAWVPDPAFAAAARATRSWVHVAASGVDAFPPLASELVLTCSRGLVAEPIAEFVLSTMLAFEKRLPEVWANSGATAAELPLGSLRSKRLGIVGLGGIGSEIARLAAAFSMDVVALRRGPGGTQSESAIRRVEWSTLLSTSDHVVITAPLTTETRGMFDDAAFALMRPGVHFVNVARGGLVDQDALRRALDAGVVACASLDVTDPEPLPATHWMRLHPSVRLSPHVSWSTDDIEWRAGDRFIENLRLFVAGETLMGIVDHDRGY